MRTANPALTEKTFTQLSGSTTNPMTLSGTVQKSFALLALTVASASYSWTSTYPAGWSEMSAPSIPAWYFPGIIATLILSFVIIFKKATAPYLAPLYALGEGLLLGTISAIFDYKYPGIAFQAVLCTMGTFLGLLLAYQSRIIKATENFKLGIAAATMGVFLVYMIDFVMNFFGRNVPYLHENGTMGIIVSAVIVVIAALNLVLDFDFIEKGVEQRAPKYMEWYAAFGLLVTLVWLYLEILRLLGKSRK
ncbi:MAG: Bax inhibitor-1/YccA family protein [Pseudobdellovibrionaceae bacterium]